jgi:AraC-like DNA-binding protein
MQDERSQDLGHTIVIPPECRESFLKGSHLLKIVFDEFGVRICGTSRLVAPYTIKRHNQPFHLVIFTHSGRGLFCFDGETKVLEPNHFWVVPAGMDHDYWTDTDWNMTWFHLEPCKRWAFLNNMSYSIRASEWLDSIYAALRGALTESMRSGSESLVAAESYGRLLGIYLDRELMAEGDTEGMEMRRRIEEIWVCVQEKLHYKWHVDELAGMANVSTVHLHRLVQRYYGTTPMGMVFNLRMHRAEDLLLHTNYPLKLIADLVGYEGPFAFSKAFKRYSGSNPQQFRTQR